MYSMSTRVEALAFKVWHDYVTNMIQAATFDYSRDNLYIISRIREKVAHFEDELPKLKDIMTILLELALWKLRMNENLLKQLITKIPKENQDR